MSLNEWHSKSPLIMNLTGLHHITAIASDPKQNVDFYTRVLGLRFVKKSVNQDDPGTYHLYYGNYEASPGTILTFFPWPGMRRGRPGHGQAYATAYSIPAGAVDYWTGRLSDLKIKTEPTVERFGDQVITLFDPDGLRVELVASQETDSRPATPSPDVPADYALRGFQSSTLGLTDIQATAQILTGNMGYREVAQAGHRTRYTVGNGGPGTYVDLLVDPNLPHGLNGAGTIHHVAFRTPDDASHEIAHGEIASAGYHISPIIDRAYFKSIYYREPGGVLFEIATDRPGFTIDEPLESLGTHLGLPPRLEPHRAAIEAVLPKLN
jgi:glyoxalase family protein